MEGATHSSAFIAATFALVAKGYTIEISRVRRASYHGKVRNAYSQLVGTLEFRDPTDEPNSYAQGLSYSSYIGGNCVDRVCEIIAQFV